MSDKEHHLLNVKYDSLVKNIRTTEKKKTRLLPQNILHNITTTSYEKVICYLKELRAYFGGSAFTSNFFLEKRLSSINEEPYEEQPQQKLDPVEEKKKFAEKIAFIIETIESQNLYSYHHDDFDDGEEDMQSIIGYLESYSNNQRRDYKFPTTKGPTLKLQNKLLIAKNQEDDTNNKFTTDKLELKSVYSFQPQPKDESNIAEQSSEFSIKNIGDAKELKYINQDSKKTSDVKFEDKSNTANDLKITIEPPKNSLKDSAKPLKDSSNNNLFNFNSVVINADGANNEENQDQANKTINNNDYCTETNLLDVSNINYAPLVTNIPNITTTFENKFTEVTVSHELLDKNFNIFNYTEKIGETNVMSNVFKFCMENFDKVVRFPVCDESPITLSQLVDFNRLNSFAVMVREKYHKNPYHNHLHGIDVFHTFFLILIHSPMIKWMKLKSLDVISALVASLVHDIGHPGFNNNFMINSKSDLTVLYNDIHVLENFHAAEGFKVLSTPNTNILNKLKDSEVKYFRKRFIQMILSTDPASHSKIVAIIKNKLSSHEVVDGKNIDKLVNDNKLYDDQQEILDFVISFCDTSHSCKKFEITYNWTCRVTEEFWHQGDVEKELEIPVSFLCDRVDSFVGKGQIGFIQGIIMPGATALIAMCPSLDHYMQNLEENIVKWQEYLDNLKK